MTKPLIRPLRMNEDDRGIATVIGFLLILAAGLTYYYYATQADVPHRGASAEHAWDQSVGNAFQSLASGAAAAVGNKAAVSGQIPGAPDPGGSSIPIIQVAHAARASGSVSFLPACDGSTAFSAWHSAGVLGPQIQDVASGAQGCVAFKANDIYSPSFGYRFELGGIVRAQGANAYVLSGPPLTLKNSGSSYIVSLTELNLTAAGGASQGMDKSAVTVDLVPRPGTQDATVGSNAYDATWTFSTSDASAWRDWYRGQIAAAGFAPTNNYACTNADATPAPPPAPQCGSQAPNTVLVYIGGPVGSTGSDLSLSMSYGRYQVSLG